MGAQALFFLLFLQTSVCNFRTHQHNHQGRSRSTSCIASTKYNLLLFILFKYHFDFVSSFARLIFLEDVAVIILQPLL